MDTERNKRIFIETVLTHISRKGVNELLEYLENETDFFYAPCSTRYHLCVEGGLVQHSLRVGEIFDTLCEKFRPDFPVESRYICSLFHDICKYHCYTPVKKSRKTGNLLPNGKPEWEDYTGYDFVEELPYGHGEKSVYILQKYLTIDDVEAMVIRWHMGYSDASFKGGMQTVSNAIAKYPVIALLHSADLIATAEGN